MLYKEKYILLNTFYDKIEIEELLYQLDSNNIQYKIHDKSNLTNFRVPSSAYIEVDIHIKIRDYDKAIKLLKLNNY